MYRVLQKILAEGGVQSLWRGNLINCMKVGPESAIRLFTFEQVSVCHLKKNKNRVIFKQEQDAREIFSFI